MRKYSAKVEEDPDDPNGAILTFPDEMLNELDWRAGDVLKWVNNKDGSATIINHSKHERDFDGPSCLTVMGRRQG
jgi:bifunctional DNA-binding transcriptional regulator/antitoxin component of YhaV-PrlF toxin-antitoxin module